MSSFRPSPDFRSCEFVPARLPGNVPDFLDLPCATSGEHPTEAHPDSEVVGNLEDPPGSGPTEWTAERIEELEQAAFERGVESARKEAEELARVCGVLESAAGQLEIAAVTSVVRNRELILELAAEIAEKWVGAELRIDPGRFHDVLDRAVSTVGGAEAGRLLLNPHDLEVLTSQAEERVSGWSREHALVAEADADLAPGAFRIEVGDRLVDGRPEVIRSRLVEALAEALETDLPEVGE